MTTLVPRRTRAVTEATAARAISGSNQVESGGTRNWPVALYGYRDSTRAGMTTWSLDQTESNPSDLGSPGHREDVVRVGQRPEHRHMNPDAHRAPPVSTALISPSTRSTTDKNSRGSVGTLTIW
jgi:hypothetical protein